MLRKVIAGLIERVIGSYVEDVNGEKLSIGLLNGTIGRVSVHIPYTHLWSQPWQLCIEDVELIAYPSASELYNRQTRAMGSSVDYQPVDSTQTPTDASSFDQKYYLAQMEEKWWKTIHSTGVNDATALAAAVAMGSDADASSWLSYLASFGYAVVRSIQIEIHNVHLRIVQHASPTDLLIVPESLLGAFTISLEHLTVKTTDVGNQETNTECKLIKMDNFCVKWSEVVSQGVGRSPSSTADVQLTHDKLLYVLPPSSLTGQLKRSRMHESASPHLVVDRSFRNRLVQLEFDTGLGDLKLQLSRDMCKASVHLAELVTLEQHRMEQFARRPKVPVRLNATEWWKYIAGEIRPQLRPLFNSTLRINLVELAAEARSNLLYVDAYTNYLVRGLTTLYQPSSAKQPVGSMESDGLPQSESDCADYFRRHVADEQWPVGRIAALRLVAMRRAASVLHEFVKPQRLKQSADVSSHSGSPLSSPCPIEGGNHHQQQLEQQRTSVSASPGAMSWYAWWRYSSLLGIRTLWYGPEATEGVKPSLSQSDEIGSSRSRTVADSPPTVKQAIFELLDELALSSDPLGEVKSPSCVPEASARLHYEVIKQRTQANIRAILDETSKPNGFNDTTFPPRSASPSTSSFQPAVKSKRPRRWHLQLDISAPRLLLPNRFSEFMERGDVRRQPVIGLLCNFGHLRVSNWPLAETEMATRNQRDTEWVPEDRGAPSAWSAKDEDDLFLTPCGTPDNQSDAELDELDAEPRTVFGSGPSDGVTCYPAFPQVNLYQSFVVHLDELHVLVGPLNMLKKLQLWTNPEDSCFPGDTGYPTAEFRLEGFAGTWIRLTGRGAGYQGRIQLRNFSIADAVTNLGGEYDLLLAARKDVRLNDDGRLEVRSTSSMDPRETPIDPVQSVIHPLVQPPEGHVPPILEFSVNPTTLGEIYNCVYYLTSLSEIFPGSSRPSDEPSSASSSSSLPSAIQQITRLTVDRFSVLVIRVIRPTPTTDEAMCHGNVCRAERIVLTNLDEIDICSESDCPSLCPNRLIHCTSNRVCTRFDSAELLFVEFAKFPALHISSPVLVERMLHFYRSVICPNSSRQSSGAEQILAPISGCVWLSSPISGFHLPLWYTSTARPSDLFSDSSPESLDPSLASDQPSSSSSNNLEPFLLELKVERAVRIYLTKPVCLHLSRFLLSVSTLRTQFSDTGGSLEPVSMDSPKNRISFCLSLPHLQLDTMADLDINPVPLACLRLNDVVVKLTQASNTTPHLSSCGELFARDVVLCDMLPVENGSTPNVDPILLSVLPENAESAAVSKTASAITTSCPDLTSNWGRESKIHHTSVGSCSHAISDDQLAMCEACSAYETFANSLRLLHTAALRIQLLMLSNLVDSGVPEKFGQITTNSANDCSLYNERFRIRSPAELSVDSTLRFRLLRSLTPSPGNLEINGYIWARIAPSIYVHIQSFMIALLDSIVELFDLRDMFSRARKSAEGQMINTQAPTSPRFLLDIVLADPRFVVPVSSHSPEALVVVMDRLMVKTACLCTHDEVDFVSPIDESRRYRPHCFQRLPVSDPLFQCRCCPSSSASQESSPIVPSSDALVQCLHFSDYLVTPGQQPNRLRRTLFDAKSMQFRLERNLHSARSHHSPDWRLVTPLTDIQIYLNEHIYSVVRGLLSHNFGDAGSGKDKTESSSAGSLLDRFKLPQLRDLRHPSYYPLKAGLQSAPPQSSFAYQLCAENSELELVGPRDCAKSSSILLQPPRPPKLNVVCTTSNISVRVSPHIIRELRSMARLIRRQISEPTSTEHTSDDGQIKIVKPLEGNENTGGRPFTVASWIQRLDSLANWISPFVHDIKIQTGFSVRILRSELRYLVPIFDALLPRLTLTWCREETSPIGVLKADGFALNYFNRDLVAWEPALEPW
ncbi:hypothetical protein X801_04012, partial [Opisthorchis viverrini]